VEKAYVVIKRKGSTSGNEKEGKQKNPKNKTSHDRETSQKENVWTARHYRKTMGGRKWGVILQKQTRG